MSDIVERLQAVEHADVAQKYLMIEAAQHVEKLEAEIERLRELIIVCTSSNVHPDDSPVTMAKRIAELEAGEAAKIAEMHHQTTHHLERIAELEAALPRAYSEGFSEGMMEHTTPLGGENMWRYSKTYAALKEQSE